jgi:tungstate transport system substrate-binding protein
MISRRFFMALAGAVALGLASLGTTVAAEKSIVVQSTTSTANSGLFDYLLPIFQAKTGIRVDVVAVGTGQAIKNAMNGDGDVLFVHSKADEEKFVAEGYGVKRLPVMYNDFMIVGPASDPAGVSGGKNAADALAKIAEAKAPFVSRGDDSGTHKAELKLWKAAGVDARAASGTWYSETGSGMGQTLNVASGMRAYTLTDRATFAAFKNKGDLAVLVEGDKALFNQYGVMVVNPAKFPRVKADLGQIFVDWIVSKEGQDAIAGFTLDGAQVFFPNADSAGS